MRRVRRLLGRVVRELGRGAWLILRSIHRLLYRRFGPRIWWIYIGIAVVALLLITGELQRLIVSFLGFAVVLALLWTMIHSALRGGRKKKD